MEHLQLFLTERKVEARFPAGTMMDDKKKKKKVREEEVQFDI